jgi:hypothetical protein
MSFAVHLPAALGSAGDWIIIATYQPVWAVGERVI